MAADQGAWLSVPIGVVTLAERFPEDAPGRAWFRDMVEAVKAPIAAFATAEPLREVFDAGRAHLIGTSGAITSLAGLHLGLPRYDAPPGRRPVDDPGECEAVADACGLTVASAAASPASAPTAPTWCWPARRSCRRCRRSGRASGCGSPTAACAKACCCR
jgi:exopolyphosphatase/guanosine-5'-triphosphate,3'-diphosphate pyrophosphatase